MTILCLATAWTGSPAAEHKPAGDESRSILIGADLMPAVMLSGAGVHFSHAAGRHWSIYAGAWLDLRRTAKGFSQTEKDHYGEFSVAGKQGLSTDFHICECAVQYWTGHCFKGTFLSLGIRYGDRTGVDAFAEAGFRIRIVKGLGISLSLKCGIAEGIRKGGINTDNINIGINYAF